jgi:beta-N-acetylhexosaminidase
MIVPKLKDLTFEQKIGQLFLARTPKLCAQLSGNLKLSDKDIGRMLDQGLVAGFYAGRDTTPEEIRSYQERSPIPLLIATDVETGAVGWDMSKMTPLPMQMAMAAFATEKEVYEWAKIAALESRAYGFNYAFGPVADLALDPASTLVGLRTFGDKLERVASLAAAAVKGYQDHGMLVSLKHFPGFGGSPCDAHIQMNVLNISKETFRKRELEVYRRVCRKVRLSGVMSGHIFVPSMDKKECATTSRKMVAALREAGFDGVLITDSLAMKGLKLKVDSKYAHQMSLAAGHDMILADYNVSPFVALDYIREAVEKGMISEEQLNRSVERVLEAKRRIFDFNAGTLNPAAHMKTSENFSARSITVRGKPPSIPREEACLIIVSEETNRSMVRGELILDTGFRTTPENYLKERYPNARFERISEYPNAETIERLLDLCVGYEDIIFIAYAYPSAYKGNSHLTRPLVHLVNGLAHKIKVFLLFGLPFAALDLPQLPCIVFGYLGGSMEKSAFSVLTGERKANGRLPVKI